MSRADLPPYCLHCLREDGDLGVVMLNNRYLHQRCAPRVDTTYCDVCGILGIVEDFVFASNGDGPVCPDRCLEEIESEIAHADDDWGHEVDDGFDEPWADETPFDCYGAD